MKLKKSVKITLICIVALIVIGALTVLGIFLHNKSKFRYEDHLDDIIITVDSTNITLRQFGFYIYQVEDFGQKQALLYDKDNPALWWNTHFAAGPDSAFVSDIAKETAINTCISYEIYYNEAKKNGLSLDESDEEFALTEAQNFYSQMTPYQLEVTGLNEEIISDLKRRNTLGLKYMLYLCDTVDLSDYDGDVEQLFSWEGEYYINEILPNHNIVINEKLLDNLSFGKITVNKQ